MVKVRGNPLILGGLGVLTNGVLSYYCFTMGEIDIAMVFLVLFFASTVVFTYSLWELSQKKTLGASVCYWLTGVFFALMLFLIGSSRC